ncbi:hypothetical protein QA641_12535 [Bradyrhizobium sp. CB1650]|uniref:hypothetical protein n=1 Tax=Bradyrhizobium sp. CB1650 TaxID=3039153 RepID=UPI0024356005|nr:hypothetical protein [Bradyrhizobium sp. CB1650]WGD56916.1 hypothetical protein QA641_12535 [Bradyrhizobium sp. CB1650]
MDCRQLANADHEVDPCVDQLDGSVMEHTENGRARKSGSMMRLLFAAVMALPLAVSAAQARRIDWQAELDRCRALRENMVPLLEAGEEVSSIARSGVSARRCA